MIASFKHAAAALVLLVASATASAQAIVTWNFTGNTGSETFVAASAVAPNLLGSNLTRGAGLATNAGAGSFNSNGWTGQATDFFSFGFTANAGYQVDLTSLVLTTQSSATGPGSLGLFYSGDAFATALFTFNQSPGANAVASNINLTALPNLAGNVEFRIQQIGTTAANGTATTSATGTFRIGTATAPLVFSGTVAAVPEASSTALLAGGLLLVAVAVGRSVRRRS